MKICGLTFSKLTLLCLYASLSFGTLACGGGGGGSKSSDSSVFKSCGMENGPLRIMPIGDSITEAERSHNSYRLNLWDKLLVAGCNIDFVGSRRGVSKGFTGSSSINPPNLNFDLDHESYWGRRADEVLNFSGQAISAHKAHIALIHLGTNDIIQGQNAESTAQELSLMIDNLRIANPDVRIFIAQVIPLKNRPERLTELNERIKNLANSKNNTQSPITLVDQRANYDASSDNYDGIHPGPSGEEKIADRWFSAIMNTI